jgi:predicted nuclease with RNAse H fold
MGTIVSEFVTVIGIDGAAQPKRTGVAHVESRPSGPVVREVTAWGEEIVKGWCLGAVPRLLVAVDIPLGWPVDSLSLAQHRAGQPVACDADRAFLRHTDRVLREHPHLRDLDLRPMSIGADKIARASHATLRRIQSIRASLGGATVLPILLDQRPVNRPGLVEVYPAATLASMGLRPRGSYKKGKSARRVRESIVKALRNCGMTFEGEAADKCVESDHALDAVLCAVAGDHFLQGKCVVFESGQRALIEKEGWIWLLDPEARAGRLGRAKASPNTRH